MPERAGRDGFAAVYAEHAPGAYRLALRLCGDPALAEDVVADAAAKVLVSWRRGSIEDTGAYLRRAVVNRLRSVRVRNDGTATTLPFTAESVDPVVDAAS